MDTPFHVGVKFCGHCQPYRNMVDLLEALQAAAPDMCFTPWSTPGWQALLVLQACNAACATPPDTDRPQLEIVVSCVNFIEYEDESELLAAILAALRQLLDGAPL